MCRDVRQSGDAHPIRRHGERDDGLVLVWEPRNGQCIVVLAGHRGWVRCLCTYWTRTTARRVVDFPRIASGSFDKTVKIWDPLVGGALIYTIDLPAMATGLHGVCLDKQARLASGLSAAARKARRRCEYGPCPRRRSSARRSLMHRLLPRTRRRCSWDTRHGVGGWRRSTTAGGRGWSRGRTTTSSRSGIFLTGKRTTYTKRPRRGRQLAMPRRRTATNRSWRRAPTTAASGSGTPSRAAGPCSC